MNHLNTYESSYKNKNHFSFGKNWKSFLDNLDDERIKQAKRSLVEFLGGINNIKGKTFIDIGCGSGLFSLAAHLLNASKVISVDIDKSSLWCTNFLRKKYRQNDSWQIKTGSALDKRFLNTLGKFDLIYSWGVLHHTGNMHQAIENILPLLSAYGLLYIAIYNKTTTFWQGGSSNFWLKIKKLYNSSNKFFKTLILAIFIAYQIFSLVFVAKTNPYKYIKNYKKQRGMSWKHDLIDWLGGYPYEFASPDEIINFLGKRNFYCKKLIFRNGTGCNEYLFVKK